MNHLSVPPEFKTVFLGAIIVEVDFGLLQNRDSSVFVSNIATDIDNNEILMEFSGANAFISMTTNLDSTFTLNVN